MPIMLALIIITINKGRFIMSNSVIAKNIDKNLHDEVTLLVVKLDRAPQKTRKTQY